VLETLTPTSTPLSCRCNNKTQAFCSSFFCFSLSRQGSDGENTKEHSNISFLFFQSEHPFLSFLGVGLLSSSFISTFQMTKVELWKLRWFDAIQRKDRWSRLFGTYRVDRGIRFLLSYEDVLVRRGQSPQKLEVFLTQESTDRSGLVGGFVNVTLAEALSDDLIFCSTVDQRAVEVLSQLSPQREKVVASGELLVLHVSKEVRCEW